MKKFKKFTINALIIFMASLYSVNLAAQDTEATNSIWSSAYDNIIFILAGLVMVGALIAIIQLIFNFIELQKLRVLKEAGVTPEEVVAETKVPGWKRAYQWAWSIVPVGQEKNIDLGHDYDGIRELDNRLPPWWLGLMYGSIVFAVVYMYVYQWGPNEWSSKMEYEIAMEEAEEQKELFLSKMADVVSENNVKFVTDEASLAAGKEIFIGKCAACHQNEGGGLVGPNLCDDYWINGGSIQDIFTTIKYGVPEKGMISWSSQLRPSSMQNVASFIMSLKGTNPPNPKAPEGELYAGESTEAMDVDKTEEAENMN